MLATINFTVRFVTLDSLESIFEEFANNIIANMDHNCNVICKICLRKLVDVKQFSEEKSSFEVIVPCAPVQAQTYVDILEQICLKCTKLKEIKIKIETADICIEETKINIPKFENAYIKQEFKEVEHQTTENLPASFTNFESLSLKVDCNDNIPLQDLLHVDTYDNLTNLKKEENLASDIHNEIKTTTSENLSELFHCSNSNEQFQSNQLVVHHMELHSDEKPFKCDICNMQFTRLYNLKKHLHLHTGEKPYKCDVCSKVFNNAGNLKQQQFTHIPDKPFKCKACNKQFARGTQLKIHMRMHGAEKPYKCNECPEAFNISRNLKIHQLTHTGGKPYECEVCGKYFYSTGELKLHQMSHTGERPYKCKDCGKSFTGGNLKIHRRTHIGEKPFKCDVCEREFARTAQLKVHRRKHTGDKPYKCQICCREFYTSGEIKRHRKLHTGEKPYKCDDCCKCFCTSGELKQHQRWTHAREGQHASFTVNNLLQEIYLQNS